MFKRTFVVLATAVALVAPAAHAQRAVPAGFAASSTAPSLVQPAAPSAAPALAADVGPDSAAARTHDAARMAPRDHADVGPNVGLMIIGGAGIITGAVIGGKGGTLISIAGAVVGLYGLYRYLR